MSRPDTAEEQQEHQQTKEPPPYLRSCFVYDDMGASVTEDTVGRLDQERAQAQLVAHCTGQDKKTTLFAGQGSAVGFQIYSRWVLLEDVVQ